MNTVKDHFQFCTSDLISRMFLYEMPISYYPPLANLQVEGRFAILREKLFESIDRAVKDWVVDNNYKDADNDQRHESNESYFANKVHKYCMQDDYKLTYIEWADKYIHNYDPISRESFSFNAAPSHIVFTSTPLMEGKTKSNIKPYTGGECLAPAPPRLKPIIFDDHDDMDSFAPRGVFT